MEKTTENDQLNASDVTNSEFNINEEHPSFQAIFEPYHGGSLIFTSFTTQKQGNLWAKKFMPFAEFGEVFENFC